MTEAGTIQKRQDVVEKLLDLQKQATVQRSHFYVANCCTEAIQEIVAMRDFLTRMQRAIEAEGYDVMVNIEGGFSELILNDEAKT